MPEGLVPERLRVWIPIRSLGSVNAYLYPGASIVDPGMLSGRSVLSLSRALRARGLRLSTVESVVLTHFHVDHSTMVALLESEGSPSVMIGRGDLEVLRGGVEEYIRGALDLFAASGLGREGVEAMLSSHPALRMRWAYEGLQVDSWRGLRDGDEVVMGGARLRVLETPGHTPGSIVLYDEGPGVLLAGDTLLPGITPHVTLHSLDSDPLGDYLASLERLSRLPARLALPGHRDPILDPAGRAREIIAHHEERLREVLGILERLGPSTGLEVARRVRWRTRYPSWDEYPAHEKFFALGEALAHLRHLEVRGLAEPYWRGGTLLWRATT